MAPMSQAARPGSPNPDRCPCRLLCLLLSIAVLAGGSTPAPEEACSTAASASEDPSGTTVQLQPDLQTEVQTQTETPTAPPTPRTTGNYTGQSSCGSRPGRSSASLWRAFHKQVWKDSKSETPCKETINYGFCLLEAKCFA